MSKGERLFIIHMPGCPTCALVMPTLRDFRDSRPDVTVIPVDITAVEWRADGWAPEVTPTLIRLSPTETLGTDKKGRPIRYRVFDGVPGPNGNIVINPEAIQQWLKENFPRR